MIKIIKDKKNISDCNKKNNGIINTNYYRLKTQQLRQFWNKDITND